MFRLGAPNIGDLMKEYLRTKWRNFVEFLNSTVPPESFENMYDPEHNSMDHVSDYEHPDMSKAPGGYDY